MAKIIEQYSTGIITLKTKKHWYAIEFIREDDYSGWNVKSSSGINHYENGLLHATLSKALKAANSCIKNEEI